MKRVVSVSLGSSRRDSVAETEILGEKFRIERIGTDGDMDRAIRVISELDGKVDALGLGGIDLYLKAGNRRYVLRDALRMARAAKTTPVVDGSGLKDTLERRTISYLRDHAGVEFRGKKALLVCAVDRFGMAEALVEAGCEMVYGDMFFALGIPIRLRSLRTVAILGYLIIPIVSRLPFEYVYPTGAKQEQSKPKYGYLYREADIIAGDFHFIKRHMPDELAGKVMITNTITPEDVEALRARKLKMLVTTTPGIQGRSFATNVMEGVLVALAGKRPEELTREDYCALLDRVGFEPRIEYLG